jgi:5-aminolevulinate synthase
VAAGALAAIRHLKASETERRRHRQVVAEVRRRLDEAEIPHLDNPSHIVPVTVCDPVRCKWISDVLLDRHAVYVQPTVPRGTERLRVTPSPLHSAADIEHLVTALSSVWAELKLPRAA